MYVSSATSFSRGIKGGSPGGGGGGEQGVSFRRKRRSAGKGANISLTYEKSVL